MEGFWGILKQELIYQRHYMTRREAIRIVKYIEIFLYLALYPGRTRIQLLMNKNIMQQFRHHKRWFGLHYRYPTPNHVLFDYTFKLLSPLFRLAPNNFASKRRAKKVTKNNPVSPASK
jgi:hypothetical protein